MSGETGDLARRITAAVRDAAAIGTGAAIATAIHAIEPDDLEEFFHASLDAGDDATPITTGLPASPGAASGRVAMTADEAMEAGDRGEDVILVRPETTPDDVLGMQASRGILTARGGMVSHAAVVARGWGIPAVVGAGEMTIEDGVAHIGDVELRSGDEITIDGSTGHVYLGRLATSGAEAPAELETLLELGRRRSRTAPCRCAPTPTPRATRRRAASSARRASACAVPSTCSWPTIACRWCGASSSPPPPRPSRPRSNELEQVQTADFETVLEAMDGLPVTVRLLDPPLHEFLPDLLDLIAREARDELDAAGQAELAAVRRLHEANPMIGTRGVRLGLVRPGLYEMQVRALCQAAANLFARDKKPHVEIMIPLVVDAEELRIARGWVRDVLDELGHPELKSTVVTVGAMIETPRAALVAGELAKHADFFSFGTNDLTQMTYTFSRDDVESKLLPAYQALGILPANPFAVLDQVGVGELVRIACEAARATKPTIKLGRLRRACRPPGVGRLPGAAGARLGELLAVPGTARPARCRPGVARLRPREDRRHRSVEHDRGTAGSAATTAAPEPSAAPADADAGDVAGPSPVPVATASTRHWCSTRCACAGSSRPTASATASATTPPTSSPHSSPTGKVRHIEKRDMYGLLPPGKERQEALLDAYAGADVQAGLHAHYEAFLGLNEEFKQLCTDWQMRGDRPERPQRRRVRRRRDRQARRPQRPVAGDARRLRGCARAHGPLRRAARRSARQARGGATNMLTGVMCGSYHDIWMELHEDLIVLQRIDRVAEGSF